MKRLFLVIAIILTFASSAFAAVGTCTVTQDKVVVEGKHSKKIITLSCTGGTAGDAGEVSDVVLASNAVKGWYLYTAETNPGDTAPDPNYDIVINDADGVDIASGLLLNRHTSTTQLVNIGMSAYGYPLIRGNLTIVHSNQTVESATWTLILTFVSE